MTTSIESSAPRVLLRLPDVTATSAPASAAATSSPEISRQLFSVGKSWRGWTSWTERFNKLPWQFRVSFVAIVLGGAVIVAARSRAPQQAAPRSPSPISITSEVPRSSPGPTVVSEAPHSRSLTIAPSNTERATQPAADDRMAHQVFPPRVQPGVAEFEGTISSPILEATHDRARPGIH